jgi:hypothetical protein
MPPRAPWVPVTDGLHRSRLPVAQYITVSRPSMRGSETRNSRTVEFRREMMIRNSRARCGFRDGGAASVSRGPVGGSLPTARSNARTSQPDPGFVCANADEACRLPRSRDRFERGLPWSWDHRICHSWDHLRRACRGGRGRLSAITSGRTVALIDRAGGERLILGLAAGFRCSGRVRRMRYVHDHGPTGPWRVYSGRAADSARTRARPRRCTASGTFSARASDGAWI